MRVVYYTLWEQLQRIGFHQDRDLIKHIELTEDEYREIKAEAGEQWPEKGDLGEVLMFMGMKLKKVKYGESVLDPPAGFDPKSDDPRRTK